MSKHRRDVHVTGGLDYPSYAHCDPSAHTETPLIFWRRYCPLHEPVEYSRFTALHRGFPEPEPVVP